MSASYNISTDDFAHLKALLIKKMKDANSSYKAYDDVKRISADTEEVINKAIRSSKSDKELQQRLQQKMSKIDPINQVHWFMNYRSFLKRLMTNNASVFDKKLIKSFKSIEDLNEKALLSKIGDIVKIRVEVKWIISNESKQIHEMCRLSEQLKNYILTRKEDISGENGISNSSESALLTFANDNVNAVNALLQKISNGIKNIAFDKGIVQNISSLTLSISQSVQNQNDPANAKSVRVETTRLLRLMTVIIASQRNVIAMYSGLQQGSLLSDLHFNAYNQKQMKRKRDISPALVRLTFQKQS